MGKNDEDFVIVGAQYQQPVLPLEKFDRWQALRRKPIFSAIVLGLIMLACLFAEQIMNHDPAGFYLNHLNQPPNAEFYFGTDSLGRDIFSIIWYGGRISLLIGLSGACILTVLGVFYGCVSGTSVKWVDQLMMRATELLSSVPTLLIILLLLSISGRPTVFSIALIMGVTGWVNLARIVRSEVRQIQNSEYILAARLLGTSFPRILYKHLLPNFISTIMFMVVASVSSCIMMESTLSFLGLGLPVDIVSWGSMLSLSNKALLTNSWWIIVIPGAFIIVTLLCITNIGHYLRGKSNKKASNL